VTLEEQRMAVAALGVTDRQAGFLVQVLRHAGVCVPRQYCSYAAIVRGQKTHEFFANLVRRQYAVAYTGRDGRARVYHLQNKVLYRAIGDPNTRLRRRQGLDRTVERLAVLDQVLADRTLHWLATEREKRDHFAAITSLRPEELPSLTFGDPGASTTRYFPDRWPIGVSTDHRRHVFVYVAVQDVPLDFRGFLHRHGELLRAVAEWEIRLVMPHPEPSSAAYHEAFRDEVARPLALSTVDELTWYFRQVRASSATSPERMRRARREFGAPRYRALYRTWQTVGDRVLQATTSRVLADAVAHGRGRLTCPDPGHRYVHLTPLVSQTRARPGGHERGNTG
jgi:hypothetical protein